MYMKQGRYVRIASYGDLLSLPILQAVVMCMYVRKHKFHLPRCLPATCTYFYIEQNNLILYQTVKGLSFLLRM